MRWTFAKLAGAVALLAASFIGAAPASAEGWGGRPHGYMPTPHARPHLPPPHHGYGPPDHHRRWKWRRHNPYGWHGPHGYYGRW